MEQRRDKLRAGFTMVEIMIVVLIIGLLVTIAIPAFAKARRRSLQTAFINDMRIFSDASDYYTLNSGLYLEDSASGTIPAGLEEFINDSDWTRGTPIGGQWDSAYDDYGITSGIGVHFGADPNPGDAYMIQIDAKYDDGNLNTGVFRKIDTDRYYYIIQE